MPSAQWPKSKSTKCFESPRKLWINHLVVRMRKSGFCDALPPPIHPSHSAPSSCVARSTSPQWFSRCRWVNARRFAARVGDSKVRLFCVGSAGVASFIEFIISCVFFIEICNSLGTAKFKMLRTLVCKCRDSQNARNRMREVFDHQWRTQRRIVAYYQ